jgi:flagellar basal body-associated protein FliL
MARLRRRWLLIALTAVVLVAAVLALMRWRNANILAQEHAARAQKTFDAMGSHYANIALCSEAVKTARLPAEKARIRAIMKTSERVLSKLEETAAHHERLARSYGYTGTLKRPDPDSKP